MFNHEMHGLLKYLGGGNRVDTSESNATNASEEDNVRSALHDTFTEAEEKVYPNSKFSKLSCVVHLPYEVS